MTIRRAMIIMRKRGKMKSPMAPKYEVGQRVIIMPVKNQPLSPRDSGLEQYAGRVGEVTDLHWLKRGIGEVFYLYTVRLEAERKEVVLHEDELEAVLG